MFFFSTYCNSKILLQTDTNQELLDIVTVNIKIKKYSKHASVETVLKDN